MNALEYLPGLSKDRMVPIILLAPWSSARTLGRAMERVERAFPHLTQPRESTAQSITLASGIEGQDLLAIVVALLPPSIGCPIVGVVAQRAVLDRIQKHLVGDHEQSHGDKLCAHDIGVEKFRPPMLRVVHQADFLESGAAWVTRTPDPRITNI